MRKLIVGMTLMSLLSVGSAFDNANEMDAWIKNSGVDAFTQEMGDQLHFHYTNLPLEGMDSFLVITSPQINQEFLE